MPFSTSRCARHKIKTYLIGAVVLCLSGCVSAPKETAGGSADEEAELEALFEDFEAAKNPQPSTPSAVQGEPAKPDAASSLPSTQRPDTTILEEIEGQVDTGELEGDVSSVVSPEPIILSTVDLSEWEVIRGGFVGNVITGVVQENFQRPVAVAARGEYLYVVDAGRNAVLRYDRANGRLEPVLDLNGEAKGEVADIYVNPDFSFYLADPDGSRVLLYDRAGRLLQTFENRLNMAKPVAVTVMDNGHIVVADGHYDYLIEFNSAGTMVATYAGRGLEPGEFLNIMTMTAGPDGFYVGSRVGRKVQVISREGAYRYSFEEGTALFPAAIVVDEENRSYVADYMDDKIKVFDRGRMVATVGQHGVAPGQFKRISDLWLDEQFLYIADSLNGRIQIARVAARRAVIPLSR